MERIEVLRIVGKNYPSLKIIRYDSYPLCAGAKCSGAPIVHCALLCSAQTLFQFHPISSQKLRWTRGRSQWRQWGRVRWCLDRSKSLAQRGAVQWPMKSSRWWWAWPGPSTTHLHLTRQVLMIHTWSRLFQFYFWYKKLKHSKWCKMLCCRHKGYSLFNCFALELTH